MQILASAGAGKTEVVAQRVASLLVDGVRPEQIVAFTFTERAAASLRERIVDRAVHAVGPEARDGLGRLFVGTIHAYAFQLLHTHVPRYETFDVLDTNRLTAFVSREARLLDVRSLDPTGRGRLFESIKRFLADLDVFENELIPLEKLDNPLRSVAERFYDQLDRYRLLTYGQQIAQAVHQLEQPDVRASVLANLRHLIVDEYQDINPAQERLIELLTGEGVELCVVGDDDQAIYQWRGSDVRNIVTFDQRYPNVARFHLATNWRSRPTVIDTANDFATTIPGRLPKTMTPHRPAARPEVTLWSQGTERDEARSIADAIARLHRDGVAYRDIAILVRSRTAVPAILEALDEQGVPARPSGRTLLFERPEARTLGQTYCWLAGVDWRDAGYNQGSVTIARSMLRQAYRHTFALSDARLAQVFALLDSWRDRVRDEGRPVDLVGDFYELLATLRARDWDHTDHAVVNRLGALARFTTLLADYESVRRRARPDGNRPGEQVGGQDRGEWYYKNLAIHIVNTAVGAFEGFDGEPDVALDTVDLTTVHGAKGLEWPYVFVPSMTAKRFPSTRTGQRQPWGISTGLFDAQRYEGTDADERRLFYVAITRARDWLSVSRHDTPKKQRVAPSPYFSRLATLHPEAHRPALPASPSPGTFSDQPALVITFSQLAAYDTCALAYRLRHLLGFQPRLAPELGYGKAVHHVMRTIAEHTTRTGTLPTQSVIDELLEDDFYLPAANKPAHREMKHAARRMVGHYVSTHQEELFRVWETERPFELNLDSIVVSGRADVILDREGGVDTALAIVDYKTSVAAPEKHALQLQVYASAGRREGLDVRGAYLHDLRRGDVHRVQIALSDLKAAEHRVRGIAGALTRRDYTARPGEHCRSCDVRNLCPAGG
jgi:DNA helicase-2/ATP-dependent DNA helicase PcrA